MKKVFLFLLVFLIILTACDTNSKKDENSSQDLSQINNSTESSEQINEESSDDTMPINRTWPYVTGTFFQPGAFAGYTEKNWETHFNGLLEVGIDTVIIQWIAETPYGKFKSCYYPSEIVEGNKADGYSDGSVLLERCLKVAEEMDIKVFVGLNLSEEWWSIACTKVDWNEMQSELGMDIAAEIYDLYKEKYPNALYGWYFAWEMYNGMQNNEVKAGNFLNGYLDPLKELDPSMPLMLSPFVNSDRSTAEKAGQEWAKVFETANFREGDIFCCQDAVGAGWITIDQLDAYFKYLKDAVDTEPGLLFWANSENFDQSNWTSAYIDRFVRQMKIAEPYVEGYVTFAYSHYYAKDKADKAPFHYAYKQYYDTGMATSFVLEEPAITYSSGYIVITLKNSPAGFQTFTLEGPVSKSHTFNYNDLSKETLELRYKYDTEVEFTCKIFLKDYFGNEGTYDITVTP